MASVYPTSFGGNPWLYGSALASLLAIGVFGAVVVGWMLRDLWRDRFLDHPTSLLSCFRAMKLLAGSAAFIRCLPEVAYLTCYGDKNISDRTIALILMVKRIADSVALSVVAAWMGMLVMLYPFVVIALRYQSNRNVRIDPLANWPRLVRPALILATVVLISALMAVAKGVYGLHA